MNVDDIFRNIGLSPKQIQVLTASMELGSQPVSTIARKTSLNRTTVYMILNELVKMGFMTKFCKLNTQYFLSVSPHVMIDMLKRKKEEYAQYEMSLKIILPELQARFNPYISKSNVYCFEGLNGIKSAIEDILKYKKEILAYKNPDLWITGRAYEVMKNFDMKRINQRLKMSVIVQDNVNSKAYFSDHQNRKLTKIKWINTRFNYLGNEIYIYGEKVAFFSFTTGSLFGVIIESDENAKTQKTLFGLLWRSAK